MGIYIFYAVLAIGGILVHLHHDARKLRAEGLKRSRKRTLEICLLWMFGVMIGVTGVMAAFAHTFMADQTAREIGFPAGNPFQFEVAMSDLAIGVLGLMCLRIRSTDFWLATIVAASIFLMGDAVGHVREIIVAHNYEPGNAGPPLYMDVVVPLLLIALFAMYRRAPDRQPAVESHRRLATLH